MVPGHGPVRTRKGRRNFSGNPFYHSYNRPHMWIALTPLLLRRGSPDRQGLQGLARGPE